MLSLAADVNVSSTNNTPSPLRISNSTHKVIKVTTTRRTNRGTDTDKGKGRDRDSMDDTAVVQLGVDTIHHRKDPHRLRKETPVTTHLALATSLVALYLYVYFLLRI